VAGAWIAARIRLKLPGVPVPDPLPPLLGPDDPPPFRVHEGDPSSRFVVTCDHAGKRLPRSLGNLGLAAADLERHIAWDIGAAGVAEKLARDLGAFAIWQTYSRLVIDCNRPPEVESSIAKLSEDTPIPGNQQVSDAEKLERAEAIFYPYHRRIEQELERRSVLGIPSVYLAVHSFTPRYLGKDRLWHAGVLYGKDGRLAKALLDVLRREPGLQVGDNEPYFVSELTDYGVIRHAERRGLLYVELEIRQDLLLDERGQREWADRVGRALKTALGALP
jgi:predicted N-formylglutamate amidohydrolase